MNKGLIAPCGMNCGICASYLAQVHGVREQGIRMAYCAGCRVRGKMCAYLRKWCNLLKEQKIAYCHECPKFPCHRLETLDKRYRVRYRMSMIENLRVIGEKGMTRFLQQQRRRWRCPECGGTISCHNGLCFACGLEELKGRKNKYRWEAV
ncbi:MAG TPA: DUF3795 domain-containing protein [Burkholderiales bacterium]|nr:DUF3795 domain-containing protein [Burkholderiales bacterium]